MNKHNLEVGLVALLCAFQVSVSAAQWRQPDAQWLYKTVNDTELKLQEPHVKKYSKKQLAQMKRNSNGGDSYALEDAH